MRAVATLRLGWRMSELVGREPGVSCAAAAQGIRRFGKWAPEHTEIHGFVKAILDQMSNRQI